MKNIMKKEDFESGVSNEDSQMIQDWKDSINFLENRGLQITDIRDETMVAIDEKTKNLADSIIKKKTMENRIFPNQSIANNPSKSPQMAKYGISMYSPSINYKTLQKFFSVKLVKSNKEILKVRKLDKIFIENETKERSLRE